jgi:hypothetical protein
MNDGSLFTQPHDAATRHEKPEAPAWPPRRSKAYYAIQFVYITGKAELSRALAGIESELKFWTRKNLPQKDENGVVLAGTRSK